MTCQHRVAIYRGAASYGQAPPFHPDTRFPEYPFAAVANENNPAYAGVRSLLALLGLDARGFGTRAWNPLGELISPGQHVVIKPNFVSGCRKDRPEEWEQIVTHPSVVRAILDYVIIALKGSGRVTIAEGPQCDSDFDEIRRRTSIGCVLEFVRQSGIEVGLIDLRNEYWRQRHGITTARVPLSGDPAGLVRVQLDGNSEFSTYRLNGRLYGADYDVAETRGFHSNSHHGYVLSRTVMGADVLLNVPKMKTHKKTGVSLALKNIVGANGSRNCLPHHTMGTPAEGGDEFPADDLANRAQSRAIAVFKRVLAALGGCGGAVSCSVMRLGRRAFRPTDVVSRSGNWYGNDTAWRMVLDMNKCLFHFDADGRPRVRPLRMLSIVDGIVAGDGDGPVSADPKPCGVLAGGVNPLAVDTVTAELMGFDSTCIPMLHRGWKIRNLGLVSFDAADIECASNVSCWNGPFHEVLNAPHLGFRPQFGWAGHIEKSALNRCGPCAADVRDRV